MEEIFVVGVGMTPFGRMLDLDIKTLTRMATESALADAGLELTDVKAAFFANVGQGHMEGQHMIRGEIALRSMGLGGIPVVNVENACASGSSAFNLAVSHLKAGQSDVALAVGSESSRERRGLSGEPDCHVLRCPRTSPSSCAKLPRFEFMYSITQRPASFAGTRTVKPR